MFSARRKQPKEDIGIRQHAYVDRCGPVRQQCPSHKMWKAEWKDCTNILRIFRICRTVKKKKCPGTAGCGRAAPQPRQAKRKEGPGTKLSQAKEKA